MNNLNKQSHLLRAGRTSEPGRLYLVTTTTLHREPVFAELQNARTLIKILNAESQLKQVHTWCFVVMPDHLHWLMQLNDESLPRVVGRVKSLSSHQIGRPIWQTGFHDRAVREEEDLKGISRYIIANPIRAGMVESVGDYPHWDAVWL